MLGRRSRLHASLAGTSHILRARRWMQVCMWMRREGGRYGRVWACSVGFVTLSLSVCLSACRRFLISHLLQRRGSPNQRTHPLVLIPEPNNVGVGDLKKEKKNTINCRYRSLLTPNYSRAGIVVSRSRRCHGRGFPGLRGRIHCGNAKKCSKQRRVRLGGKHLTPQP